MSELCIGAGISAGPDDAELERQFPDFVSPMTQLETESSLCESVMFDYHRGDSGSLCSVCVSLLGNVILQSLFILTEPLCLPGRLFGGPGPGLQSTCLDLPGPPRHQPGSVASQTPN